ncbi:MAG: hypothetical protein GY953_55830, partial [bacterium]|nr:hypothetical protein [bacterium]
MDPAYPKGFDLYWSLGGTMFGLGARPPEPIIPRNVRTIHSGLDATEIARTYPADLAVMADTKSTSTQVLEELKKRNLSSTAVEERRRKAVEYHNERRQRLDGIAEKAWDKRPIATERLAVELNRRIHPNAIVVSELITSEPHLPSYLDIEHQGAARRTNLTASGGVLGWCVAA